MEPEIYARNLLEQLQINSYPINPFKIADALNILHYMVDAESYDGMIVNFEDNVFININKNLTPAGRQNFTMAHELGHFSIPSHKGRRFECQTLYINPFNKKRTEEVEANRFASELLMPKNLFKPLVYDYKPEFEDIAELSELFETSLSAAAIRFISFTEESCALVVSDGKNIKWSVKSSSFPYFIPNDEPITSSTLTRSYIYKGVVPEFASQETPASYWIEGKGINRNTKIIESCVPIMAYNRIYTLLWFFEPIIEEDDEEYEERYEEKEWKWSS